MAWEHADPRGAIEQPGTCNDLEFPPVDRDAPKVLSRGRTHLIVRADLHREHYAGTCRGEDSRPSESIGPRLSLCSQTSRLVELSASTHIPSGWIGINKDFRMTGVPCTDE